SSPTCLKNANVAMLASVLSPALSLQTHLIHMKLTRIACATVLAATALVLGGCASASKPTAMVASFSAPITKNPESVAVNVRGGSETSSMGASKISNADFSQA